MFHIHKRTSTYPNSNISFVNWLLFYKNTRIPFTINQNKYIVNNSYISRIKSWQYVIGQTSYGKQSVHHRFTWWITWRLRSTGNPRIFHLAIVRSDIKISLNTAPIRLMAHNWLTWKLWPISSQVPIPWIGLIQKQNALHGYLFRVVIVFVFNNNIAKL